ncbi:zinc ribbon domain-containing protein [Desulfovibrio aerotolerans]|uniref:Zinc ribbon domain-containing protein n=1 Tax=Solidesulfovibrio aerotolerans TaxID=295255 RepID=A0A7C9IX61_9BACT|nr:FmdB family zinc ribbon protein [Solidesulfovibrio aerotolerans]MYL83942.1 zinc ribbon domain-containing protein [Solidesulfovibrio aerotolerans]
MPIYDISCPACGYRGEVIRQRAEDAPACPQCGAASEKLVSPTSSLTGKAAAGLPGPADHGCCGSRPGQAGCAGPGSCCGKTPAF